MGSHHKIASARRTPCDRWFSASMEQIRADGELPLLTTLTSFATATDVTLTELHLEAFLLADGISTGLLRARVVYGTGRLSVI